MSSIHPGHGLPSPVASADSPAPSNSGSISGPGNLSTQRHHPLRPGSSKEIALINYVDDKILLITRRYGTKFADITTKRNEAAGYTNLDQVLADVDPLFDLVWSTGTPALQISYLLSLAGMLASYMPSFDFNINMFRSLRRFDAAFSTLLKENRTESTTRSAVSTTEKVRMKSLVEETRVNAVNTASASGRSVSIDELSDSDDEEDDPTDLDADDEKHSTKVALALSRIYKSTMEILGDDLTS